MVIILFVSFLSICNTSSLPTQLNKLVFSVRFHHHISKLSSYFWSAFCSVQCSAPFRNEAFVIAILDLISRVHLGLYDVMLDKCLKYSRFSNCFIYHVLYWVWLILDPFYISIFLYSFQLQTIFQSQLLY